jgi:hypothetical protein
MSDANVFRQFAEEAMCGSSKTTSKDYKRALEDLACTWAHAALMNERVLVTNLTWAPCESGK